MLDGVRMNDLRQKRVAMSPWRSSLMDRLVRCQMS